MNSIKLAMTVALCALPASALADTVALAPQPGAASNCTLTMNYVPATPPPRTANNEPVIFVDTTQSYPIKSFTLKQTSLPRTASVATIEADLDLESTVATLLDQHAVIERAELACPTKSATLTNASIGYIGTLGATRSPELSFTMNFWPKNLEIRQ